MPYKEVSFLAAGTTSSAASLDLAVGVIVALETDAALTSSNLTFTVADQASGTYKALNIVGGTAYTITSAAASKFIAVDHNQFLGVQNIKIVAATPQVDATTVKIHYRLIR